MLDKDDSPQRYVRGRDSMSYTARETACADDLHSMASSHKVLKRKADLVSAFCCVMGLELSVKKLRRFIFSYMKWVSEIPPPITFHLDRWTPHLVHVRLQGHSKYLGVQLDPDNLNAVTLQSCKDIARKDSQKIKSSRASAATNLAVLVMTTYKRVEYRAQWVSVRTSLYG